MTECSDGPVSRRDLFRLGAAGLAACAFGCRPAPEAVGPQEVEAPTPPLPRPAWTVNLGLQSFSLRSFSFDDAVAKTHELGLHFIEFTGGHFPQNLSAQELAARQQKLADLGIQANAYGVCRLNNNEQAMRRLFGFCKKAGIGVVTAAPTPDCFDLLDKLVGEYDLKVAIHNHGPGDKRWGRTKLILAGIEGHNARIGACLDTGHLIRAGDDPIEAVRAFGPRLHAVHFKDVQKGSSHDCVVGEGRIDLAAFFQALREGVFDGAFSLEYELEAKNPMPGITRSLAAMRQALAALG